MTDATKEPGIRIAQVFLQDVTFAHREDALMLPASTRPEIGEVEIQIAGGVRPDGKAALVSCKITTQEKLKPLYRVSLTFTALFEVREGEENMPLEDYIRDAAPALLFPFVREAFANVTGRGRFGAVWLDPINTRAISRRLREQAHQPPQPAEGDASSLETSAREAMLKEQMQK